jgi:hypothetical protein
MNNWNILPRNLHDGVSTRRIFVVYLSHLVDGNVSDLIRLIYRICEKKEITTIKGRFH